QTDKDGNPKPRLEDANNHAIDGTRYALSQDMVKGQRAGSINIANLGFR
ncbi:MAG: PBSX family phage terminase large subunit, partial [Tetragenococcus sp.]|nr:PBSX family phage terminase large subunit [Tetragenococcus sp.]